jgi:hypothetical protein
MTRVSARVVGALAAVVLVVGAVPALAAKTHKAQYTNTPNAALRDCSRNDPLKGHYTVSVLNQALKELSPSGLQYTACETVLQNAIDSLLVKHHTHGVPQSTPRKSHVTPATRGSGPQSPTRRRIRQLKNVGGLPVILPSGQTLTPGAVSTRGSSFLSGLPTPLLIVLAALLAAVVAVAARSLQRIVRARRSV